MGQVLPFTHSLDGERGVVRLTDEVPDISCVYNRLIVLIPSNEIFCVKLTFCSQRRKITTEVHGV